MDDQEYAEKRKYHSMIEQICQSTFHTVHPESKDEIFLRGFGSLESGFATKGSDIDLGVIYSPGFTQPSETFTRDFPRLLERALVQAGLGARLLTKTRVPILKICEKPDDKLYTALVREREKWDALPEAEKYPANDTNENPDSLTEPAETQTPSSSPLDELIKLKSSQRLRPPAVKSYCEHFTLLAYNCLKEGTLDIATAREYILQGVGDPIPQIVRERLAHIPSENVSLQVLKTEISKAAVERFRLPKEANEPTDGETQSPKRWTREKLPGPLDFPKSGVGILCDINFSNQLGVHNTELLRCYSLCDPRVFALVLFVKAWAKKRKINSAYSGTMSSYGYVLMILHFLINVEHPPVLPNLQVEWPEHHASEEVSGYTIKFLRNPQAIAALCAQPQNQSTVGILLHNFFKYYAVSAQARTPANQSFNWMRDVISIRTPGGILRKDAKGWTSARTIHTEQVWLLPGKAVSKANSKQASVRQRYLFAIEDPFELDHNVARTVTHQGIVAIRDEFRRAWRIIQSVKEGKGPDEDLFAELVEPSNPITVAEGKNADNEMPQATAEAQQLGGDLMASMSQMTVQDLPQHKQ
jgi:terminal uridylyltransferase